MEFRCGNEGIILKRETFHLLPTIFAVFIFIGCDPYLDERPIMRYDFQKLYSISYLPEGEIIPDNAGEGSFYLYNTYWDEVSQENVSTVGYVSTSGIETVQGSFSHPDVEFNGPVEPTHLPRYFVMSGRVPDPNDNWMTLSYNILLYRLTGSGSSLGAELLDNYIIDTAEFPAVPSIERIHLVYAAGDRIYLILGSSDETFYEVSYSVDEAGFSDPRERFSDFLTRDEAAAAIGFEVPDYYSFYGGNPLSMREFYAYPDTGKSSYFFGYTELPSEDSYLYNCIYDGVNVEVVPFNLASLMSAGETDYSNNTAMNLTFIPGRFFIVNADGGGYDPNSQSPEMRIYTTGGDFAGSMDLFVDWNRSLSFVTYTIDDIDGSIDFIFQLDKTDVDEVVFYSLPSEEVLE